jgi:DNA-binding CsgD family transcriptional regulator
MAEEIGRALTRRQLEAVSLIVMGLTRRETAVALGIHEAQVYALLARARERVAQMR